jgi:hypothetical protein
MYKYDGTMSSTTPVQLSILTNSTRIQRLHIEDINSLHLSEDFQALKAGSLLEIGRDSSWSCTRGKEI